MAQTILEAPGWAKVGITAPVQRIREQAAQQLALVIRDELEGRAIPDARQLGLPL